VLYRQCKIEAFGKLLAKEIEEMGKGLGLIMLQSSKQERNHSTCDQHPSTQPSAKKKRVPLPTLDKIF
jgi:hypothetical protein